MRCSYPRFKSKSARKNKASTKMMNGFYVVRMKTMTLINLNMTGKTMIKLFQGKSSAEKRTKTMTKR
jgi:hypothetical protein